MPDEPTYRVSWSREAIKALTAATQSGHEKLADLVRALDGRLRKNPLEVGEVYWSRGAVDKHLAVHQYLAIDFAVDTKRKFVFVRSCNLLS